MDEPFLNCHLRLTEVCVHLNPQTGNLIRWPTSKVSIPCKELASDVSMGAQHEESAPNVCSTTIAPDQNEA
jgi:hypothetical protein